MSKRQFLIILGVWVMIFLFLGFPSAWDKIFALVTGLLLIIVAFRFKSPAPKVSPEAIPFVERKSTPTQSRQVDSVTVPTPTSSTDTITNSDMGTA